MILVSHALCSQDMKQTLRIYVIFLFRAATEKGLTEHPRPSLSSPPPTVPSSFPLLLFLDLSISLDSTLTVCTASGSKNRRTGWCVCYEEGKRESRGKRGERRSRWRTRDGTHQTRDKNDSSNVNTWKLNICRCLAKFYESFI